MLAIYEMTENLNDSATWQKKDLNGFLTESFCEKAIII